MLGGGPEDYGENMLRVYSTERICKYRIYQGNVVMTKLYKDNKYSFFPGKIYLGVDWKIQALAQTKVWIL